MSELDLEIDEPLLQRETIENALDKCRDAIQKSEGGGLARFSWPLLRSNIADAVSQSASTDKVHWMLKGWSFARELKAYKDPAKHPPGETAILKLGDHELEGTFHPVVTVSCEGMVVCKLTFDVDLAGLFHAVSIAIRDGHITGCGGGECDLTVVLKYRDVDLTGPISIRKVKLPGKIEFAEPIAIP